MGRQQCSNKEVHCCCSPEVVTKTSLSSMAEYLQTRQYRLFLTNQITTSQHIMSLVTYIVWLDFICIFYTFLFLFFAWLHTFFVVKCYIDIHLNVMSEAGCTCESETLIFFRLKMNETHCKMKIAATARQLLPYTPVLNNISIVEAEK